MHPSAVLDEKDGESQCQKIVRRGDLPAASVIKAPSLSSTSFVVLANATTHTAESIVRSRVADDLRDNNVLWLWIPDRARKGSLVRDDGERVVACIADSIFKQPLSPTSSPGLTGRSSIPETPMLKSRGRGVLDAPLARSMTAEGDKSPRS